MLTGCTLTGIEDGVPLAELGLLSFEFPLAEWGVLYSPARTGTPRYPTPAYLRKVAQASRNTASVRFALHVCGKGVDELLAGEGLAAEIAPCFRRIQINLKSKDAKAEAERIAALLPRLPKATVILQHNRANAKLADLLSPAGRLVALLFDASAGAGKRPKKWPAPIPGRACGYAGGLRPDDLPAQLLRIDAAAGEADYWIDMESSLRDDRDRFSLSAARAALQAAADHRAAKT